MEAPNGTINEAANGTMDAADGRRMELPKSKRIKTVGNTAMDAPDGRRMSAHDGAILDAPNTAATDASNGNGMNEAVDVGLEEIQNMVKFDRLIELLDTEGRGKLALELSGKNQADTAKGIALLGYFGDVRFTTEDFSRMTQSEGGRTLELLLQVKLIDAGLPTSYELMSLSGLSLQDEEVNRPMMGSFEPLIIFFCKSETSKALYDWFSNDASFLNMFGRATGRESSVNGLHKWMLFENVKENELLVQHDCFRAVWPKVVGNDGLLKEVKSFAKFTSLLERPLQEQTFERLKALCGIRERDTVVAGVNFARPLRGEAPDQRVLHLLRELLTVSRDSFGEVDELTLAVGDALVLRLRLEVPNGGAAEEGLKIRTDLYKSCQRLLGDEHKLTLMTKRLLDLEYKMGRN